MTIAATRRTAHSIAVRLMRAASSSGAAARGRRLAVSASPAARIRGRQSAASGARCSFRSRSSVTGAAPLPHPRGRLDLTTGRGCRATVSSPDNGARIRAAASARDPGRSAGRRPGRGPERQQEPLEPRGLARPASDHPPRAVRRSLGRSSCGKLSTTQLGLGREAERDARVVGLRAVHELVGVESRSPSLSASAASKWAPVGRTPWTRSTRNRRSSVGAVAPRREVPRAERMEDPPGIDGAVSSSRRARTSSSRSRPARDVGRASLSASR